MPSLSRGRAAPHPRIYGLREQILLFVGFPLPLPQVPGTARPVGKRDWGHVTKDKTTYVAAAAIVGGLITCLAVDFIWAQRPTAGRSDQECNFEAAAFNRTPSEYCGALEEGGWRSLFLRFGRTMAKLNFFSPYQSNLIHDVFFVAGEHAAEAELRMGLGWFCGHALSFGEPRSLPNSF